MVCKRVDVEIFIGDIEMAFPDLFIIQVVVFEIFIEVIASFIGSSLDSCTAFITERPELPRSRDCLGRAEFGSTKALLTEKVPSGAVVTSTNRP
jgi:hypothetical protein